MILIENNPSGVLAHCAVPGQYAQRGHHRPRLHQLLPVLRNQLHGVAQLHVSHGGGNSDADKLGQRLHAKERLAHLGVSDNALEQHRVPLGLHHVLALSLVVGDPQGEPNHAQPQHVPLPEVREHVGADQVHYRQIVPAVPLHQHPAAEGAGLLRRHVFDHTALPLAGGHGVGVHAQQLLLPGVRVQPGADDRRRVAHGVVVVIAPVAGDPPPLGHRQTCQPERVLRFGGKLRQGEAVQSHRHGLTPRSPQPPGRCGWPCTARIPSHGGDRACRLPGPPWSQKWR